MADPPQVPEPPLPPEHEDRPARQGELRSLRRWVIVTAVWALAAMAIALIALLTLDETAEKESRGVSQELSRLQKSLDRRLDALEEDVSGMARREDVTNLAQRLSRVETKASKAGEDTADTSKQIDDLETRVEELESAPKDTGGAGAGGGNQDDNP